MAGPHRPQYHSPPATLGEPSEPPPQRVSSHVWISRLNASRPYRKSTIAATAASQILVVTSGWCFSSLLGGSVRPPQARRTLGLLQPKRDTGKNASRTAGQPVITSLLQASRSPSDLLQQPLPRRLDSVKQADLFVPSRCGKAIGAAPIYQSGRAMGGNRERPTPKLGVQLWRR
jgi:hypothetical protein